MPVVSRRGSVISRHWRGNETKNILLGAIIVAPRASTQRTEQFWSEETSPVLIRESFTRASARGNCLLQNGVAYAHDFDGRWSALFYAARAAANCACVLARAISA